MFACFIYHFLSCSKHCLMTKVLQVNVETFGSTKIVYHAHYMQKEIVTCKITWFPLQETAYVWLWAPVIHSRHCVTQFQKLKGTFQDVVQEYMAMFQQMMWLLLPVVQGRSSLDTLPYRLCGLKPTVLLLVRALLQVKKKVDLEQKWCHGHKQQTQRQCSQCGVDDRASNTDATKRSASSHV